jgi:hypothetical protein
MTVHFTFMQQHWMKHFILEKSIILSVPYAFCTFFLLVLFMYIFLTLFLLYLPLSLSIDSLYLSLPLSTYLFLSLSLYLSLPLSLPLSASLCLSLPLSASLCLPLPLSASLCHSLPLSASLCLSLPLSFDCYLSNSISIVKPLHATTLWKVCQMFLFEWNLSRSFRPFLQATYVNSSPGHFVRRFFAICDSYGFPEDDIPP